VHQDDARRLGQLLEPHSPTANPLITCTITSPPYGNLKNYGHPDQIGYGQPYEEYLIELRRVFRTLYRHTRADGSLWVIADTLRSDATRELQPLPFALAAEAAEAGWMLKETVIWQKDKTLPWSSGGRMRNTFEYVLLLVKSLDFKFYVDRLRDPTELTQWWVKWPERYNPHGRVPTNIWDIPIPVQGSWKTPAVAHACPLPPDLVERLLLLSTDDGDVVLDPFAGTGVVVAEADRLGRRGIGVELNKNYVKAYEKYVRPEIEKRNANDRLVVNAELVAQRRDALIKLRALKYPKMLVQQLSKEHPKVPTPYAVAVILDPFDRTALLEGNGPLQLRLVVAVKGDGHKVDMTFQALKRIEERAPATKFGVQTDLVVVTAKDFVRTLSPRKRLWLYEAGRTWDAAGRADVADIARLAESGAHSVRGENYRYPPILSNLLVREDPLDT
jgi:DNA modification methylase